jgi:hypothetical protein
MTDKNEQVKFYYTGLGSGNLTLAYKIKGDRNSDKRIVEFGYSFCNPDDRFSKRDIVVTHVKRKYNRETKQTEILATEKVVTEGGRTRALKKLNEKPVVIEVSLEGSDISPVASAIECMLDFCWKQAPSWKTKTKHFVTRHGAHVLVRDGFTLTFADPRRNEMIYLNTPWGVETA